MQHYTIIPDDGFVSVDGIGYSAIPTGVDDTIHAVQWYGTYGEIEYKPTFNKETKQTSKDPNLVFEDVFLFKKALDNWKIADSQAKEQAAVIAAQALEASQADPLLSNSTSTGV